SPGSCSEKRSFACQKHRYDPDHRPNVIGELDLPAGKWYVTVQVAPSTQRSCFVQARVQSDLQIVPGFVTTVTGDQPDNDPVQDSPNNRLITYIHSLDNAHRSPILTHALLNDAANGTFYNAVTYSQRAQCSYPWQTQSFSCPNSDSDDNEFTITQSPATVECVGKVFVSALSTGQIVQLLIFENKESISGKQCNIPICVNGGVLSPDYRRCDCPDGYSGEHCEFELCMSQTPITFSPNAKTFVLVVETTFQNKPMIDVLVANLATIVNGAPQSAQWFSNYALVTYDSSGVTSPYPHIDIDCIVMGLNSAAGRMTDNGACTTIHALQIVKCSPSHRLVSVINKYAMEMWSSSPMSKLISPTSTTRRPIVGLLPVIIRSRKQTRLAYSSSGNVLFIAPSDLSQMFSVYLPTLYGSYVLTNPTGHQSFQCSTPSDWYVEVDYATTRIYVTTSATYGNLGVVSPLRDEIAATVLYKTNNTQFYEIDVDRLPGIYTLSLTSAPLTAFFYRLRCRGAKVYYDFAETTSADPTASHIDGYNGSPEVGVSNVLTLHVDATPGSVLKQIELFDPDSLQVLLRSPLYRRMNCSFEYYSDPFTCTSEAIAMFVYGEDDSRQPFRRQELTYCNTPINPTTSADEFFIQSNATADEFLVEPTFTGANHITGDNAGACADRLSTSSSLSMSARVHQQDTNDMSQFVTSLLSAYDVSQSYTRVGVVPVFGNSALGPMVTASLNAVSSIAVLKSYLDQTKEYNDFDSQGQALAQGLYTAINPNFKNAGYRSDISNHLIVYITATS
ncbi:hypothetical protein OSTOST_15104, partial [Ostertagia ostertagi]